MKRVLSLLALLAVAACGEARCTVVFTTGAAQECKHFVQTNASTVYCDGVYFGPAAWDRFTCVEEA